MTSIADFSTPPSYGALLGDLKERIRGAQSIALRAVNKELIALYWDIGQRIDERQQAEGWGKGVVEALSKDLRSEFGEKSGYSVQNLWYMRKFYREYKDLPNLQPLAGEIAWTKNTLILDRCDQPLQREFYLRATARFGWTRRVLDHQIDNQSYEKYLLNQTSFDQALAPAVAAQAKLAVKDHYTFDFLSLGDAHEERELEAGLIANIRNFLTEMGPNFSFNNALVATGTGSGKTECFLYPVLDHCVRAKSAGEQGIKALVIYPMNALATDQARRIATIAPTAASAGEKEYQFIPNWRGQEFNVLNALGVTCMTRQSSRTMSDYQASSCTRSAPIRRTSSTRD